MGFFGKLWKVAKKAAKIAIESVPFGGIVTAIFDEIWPEGGWNRGGETNPYAENQVEIWNSNVFSPWYASIAPRIFASNVTSSSYVLFFNSVIETLYTWQAYYEFVGLKSNDDDEKDIAALKVEYIGGYIYAITEAWKRATAGTTTLQFYPYPFNPAVVTKIATENLNWKGVTSITAEKWVLTDKPHGGLPPNGGGSSPGEGNPGGGTTTG
ncbi:MAG: hypothetical protein CL525_07615, partial [Aequorivita sp.]|nr:hypothetical protein [Aequorivita sp.]